MNRKIEMICPKCGTPPSTDPKKSNKNWKVYPTNCAMCGAKLKLILTQGKTSHE